MLSLVGHSKRLAAEFTLRPVKDSECLGDFVESLDSTQFWNMIQSPTDIVGVRHPGVNPDEFTHFRCDPHQIPLIQTAGCPEPGGHVRAHGGRHVHFAQTLPNEPLRLLFKHAQDVLFGFYTAGSPLPHDNHPDLLKGALTLRQAG